MQRKLIKQGGGGYTIYLPKKWVDKKNLDSGDYVDVIETDSSLVIGSSAKEKRDILVSINEDNRKDIKNILTHAYRKGFNKISFSNIDSTLVKEIKSVTETLLLGFEVTQKDKNLCIIENVSEPSDEKYDLILKRAFLIINETIDEIANDLGAYKNRNEIEVLKNNHDKYILFCRRLLSKDLGKDIMLSWEILTFLTHIEHNLFYLYQYSLENKIKTDNNISQTLEELKEYFKIYQEAYYKKDISFVHKINNLKSRYHFGKIPELIEKSSGKKAVIFSYLRETFRLIQIGSSPLLALIISY